MTRSSLTLAIALLLPFAAGVRPALAGAGSDTCVPGLSTGGGGGTATSQPLPIVEGRWAVLTDGLTTAVPIHCWNFTVSAGSYVWAYVQPLSPGATTEDSVLKLLRRSTLVALPPALLEEDDDDGEYKGSSIAGRRFTQASELFVQISSKTGPLDYRLHVFVTRGAPMGIAGDVPRRANGQFGEDLLLPGKAFGWANANTTPEPFDGGHWLIGLREGEIITVVVDGSPMGLVNNVATRPAAAPLLAVQLLREGQPGIYQQVDSSPGSNPSSLAFSFVVPVGGGNFIIRIQTSTPSLPITILAARSGAPFAFDHTDLELTLVNKTEPAVQNVTYALTYRVTNRSTSVANSFALSVAPLSAASFFVDGASAACDDDPGRAGAKRCPFADLAPGQSRDLVFSNFATPSTASTATWVFTTAIVASGQLTSLTTFDVAPENDMVVTTVESVPSLPLSVTADSDTQLAGNHLFLGARVKNASVVGPVTGALGYTLTVDFQAPLTLLNVGTSATLACTGTGQQRVCTGDLEKNQEESFTFTFTGTSGLPPGRVIPVTFRVAPTGQTVDTSPGDNVATAFAGIIGTPSATDSDGDGMSNVDEGKYGLNPNSAVGANGPVGDPDQDGVPNATEVGNDTHPRGFYRRYFAEGSTGPFFDERIALLNRAATVSHVLVKYLRPAPSAPISQSLIIGSNARATIDLETVPGLESTAVSAFIEADTEIIADRTMSWDASGYGAHAETAVDQPRTSWYFAEGSTVGGFNLFYLLQNPSDAAGTVTIKYLRPVPLPPITKTYSVAPNSRQNVWVNQEGAELAATDVSAVVTSTVPIIAERAMYLDRPGQIFGAGHDAVGIAAPQQNWYLAEGATGPYFDLFVLLANPNDQDAVVEVKFLKPDGSVITRTKVIAANARSNIWVDFEDPLLADTAVSTTVSSTNGVSLLVERAMWWPGTSSTWHEAHASAGLGMTGEAWALAEGEVGGPRNIATYILVANTGSTDVNAKVTLYFESGTPVERTFSVKANSRFNVDVGTEFPASAGQRFGAFVTAAQGTLIVERAMYWDASGVRWAAGTNAVATRVVP